MKQLGSLAVALAVLGAPASVNGQDTEWNRYTLEDLGGVYVTFEVNDVCTAAGVSASDYEANVSLQLIESEVGVLTQAEMLQHPAMPELRVSLDCADGQNGMSDAVAFAVGLRVQQSAQMLRDTQITLPEAVTWYATKVGVSSGGGAADAIEAALMAGIAEFAEAWAAVHAEDGGEG